MCSPRRIVYGIDYVQSKHLDGAREGPIMWGLEDVHVEFSFQTCVR